MKEIKKFLMYFFTTFGLSMAMLFTYSSTVENPVIDWYVAATTATLSCIFSAWLCDLKNKNDKKGEDK